MKCEMKELNLNEMEQANGGTIIGLVCVAGLLAGAISLAIGVGKALEGTDIKIPSHRL